jgi:hypothetical protein
LLKKTVLAVCVVILLATAYLLLWPVPIDPLAWQPPPAPDNGLLANAGRLLEGLGEGPEAVIEY